MIQLRVPSKTFLVGEYAVLQGAPALVAATGPYFQFSATKSSEPQKSLFHENSAASRWFRQSEVLLKEWSVNCQDPHEGGGGFGASGAQFVFYHALATYLQSQRAEDDAHDVWQDYKACEKNPCSGADVVAQTLGGITCFQAEPFDARSYRWPFDESDFVILKTGQKVETHSHLQKMLPPLEGLVATSKLAVEAFFKSNIEAFTSAIAMFQRELVKAGLQAETTIQILEAINSGPGVLVSKGCGAMGADTVLALIDAEYRSEFLEFAKDLNLKLVATASDLAPPSKLKAGA
jgi:mevalonate kinase